MFKRVLLLAALLASALAAGSPLPALAQGSPSFIVEAALPNSERQKFPHIDTFGSTVYVAGNAEREFARLWTKADTATSFPEPRTLGNAGGTPDYATASVFAKDDGTIYVAWINANDRRIYMRWKGPSDADFRPQTTVYGVAQPFEVEVAANEDGVFVFWREVGLPVKYRRSPDGTNWNVPAESIGTVKVEPFLDVAAGPGRKLAVAYYRDRIEGDDAYLQGYLGIWNGSGFLQERIPAVPDRNFANPSVAVGPDGSFSIAMRSTEKESGLGAGVYVADRSPTGTWSNVIRLARGDTLSTGIDIDPAGNTHLFINSKANGPVGLYYTYRRPGQGYGGGQPNTAPDRLLAIQEGGQFIANVRAAASLRDRSYGHAVVERFDGNDIPFGRYFLVALPVNNVGATGISIEGGAATTNKSTLNVTFTGLTGAPTEVRSSWGAPPAANAAFGPFNVASPTIAVPLPAGANPNCSALTLYTQLRAGSTTQVTPNSDTIVLDQAVQADYYVSGVTPALDPGYTNSLNATVFVYSGADCSGLASASVSGPVSGGSISLPVASTTLVIQNVQLTGNPATPGPKVLSFAAADQLGNSTTGVTRTVVYDPVAPLFTGLASESAATLVPYPDGTAQMRLALDNLVASDVGGVLAGLELVAVAPTVNGVTPTSAPVRIPFDELDSFVVNGDGSLNLRDTITLTDFFSAADLVPGTYRFTIRVLDGAGNASAASRTISETLTAVTYPVWAPYTRR